MAYMSQEKKKALAPGIKAVCEKYGVKATLAVRNHMVLVLTVKSGPINFAKTWSEVTGRPVEEFSGHWNAYHCANHFTGSAANFLAEVRAAMNVGNHDNSDIQTDYFDVGWYNDVYIGGEKPYVFTP